MIKHLTKNQSQYIFSLNGLCALLLFGKGLDGHETNLISFLPLIITLVTLITLSTLTKKRQMSLFNILSFISLIVSYIFSAKLQYPQHFFQLIFLSIPFFLLYALRLFVSQTPKLKKLLILIFLIPIFFFYRNYWSGETPFSLWVVFTFLLGMNFYQALINENNHVIDQRSARNVEKLFLLFMLVLVILSRA